MINSITGGHFVDITNNYQHSTYIPSNSGNVMQGVLRISSNNTVEIYDGTAWQSVTTPSPQINLTDNAIAAIIWAQQKMCEEAELKRLTSQHPAVADAVSNLTKAMDELKVIVALTSK
jgi:hypothetical protein